MTRHATRKSVEREYQSAFPGMTLTEAKRHLAHAKNVGVVVDDVPLAQLGVSVLPPDATPAQRARAEAIWKPAAVDHPCRCADGCTGQLIHVDRVPGGLLSAVTDWQDEYVCTECGQPQLGEVVLPEVPWGEPTERGIVVFDGVRHPAFAEPDEYGGCFECGATPGYGCTCPDPDEPYCHECGADIDYHCTCD